MTNPIGAVSCLHGIGVHNDGQECPLKAKSNGPTYEGCTRAVVTIVKDRGFEDPRWQVFAEDGRLVSEGAGGYPSDIIHRLLAALPPGGVEVRRVAGEPRRRVGIIEALFGRR